jgi:hypothetical protein
VFVCVLVFLFFGCVLDCLRFILPLVMGLLAGSPPSKAKPSQLQPQNNHIINTTATP